MRLPNEYDFLSLIICAWIVSKLHPWLPASIPIPQQLFQVGFIGTFLVSPFLFWLWVKNWKIDPFIKVILVPTFWFFSTLIPVFLQGRVTEISRDWLTYLLFFFLAEAIWKPSHRWICFLAVTFLWAWFMPGWGRLDSQTVWLSFKEFLLPLFLYLWIAGMGGREHKLMKKLKIPRIARPLRFAHLLLYLVIFYVAVNLTLNLTILKWFSPSSYLLLSAELHSMVGWLAMMGLTFALFLTVSFLLG